MSKADSKMIAFIAFWGMVLVAKLLTPIVFMKAHEANLTTWAPIIGGVIVGWLFGNNETVASNALVLFIGFLVGILARMLSVDLPEPITSNMYTFNLLQLEISIVLVWVFVQIMAPKQSKTQLTPRGSAPTPNAAIQTSDELLGKLSTEEKNFPAVVELAKLYALLANGKGMLASSMAKGITAKHRTANIQIAIETLEKVAIDSDALNKLKSLVQF